MQRTNKTKQTKRKKPKKAYKIYNNLKDSHVLFGVYKRFKALSKKT